MGRAMRTNEFWSACGKCPQEGAVLPPKRSSSKMLRPCLQKVYIRFRSFSLVTYLLVCLFGLGSWVAINGVWAETAILVHTQPECADITSILTVVVQLGNVGPLVYLVSKVLWHRFQLKQLHLEVMTVLLLVSLAAVACGLLSLFWASTTTVLGSEHSMALFVLFFVLSLADCTSSVVFVPFMKHLPAIYLSALYIGEGLSGVLPSLLALGQGAVNQCVSCTPGVGLQDFGQLGINYNPSVFFLALVAMMVMSGAAFISILLCPVSRKEMAATHASRLIINASSVSQSSSSSQSPSPSTPSASGDTVDKTCTSDHVPLVGEQGEAEDVEEKVQSHPKRDQVDPTTVRVRPFLLDPSSSNSSTASVARQLVVVVWTHRTILTCVCLTSFITNGALSSISAFALLKYSNLSFLLAVELGLLANPIAAFVFALRPVKFQLLTAVLTAATSILSVYMLVVALSPSPFLDGLLGEIVIVSITSGQFG